MGTYRRESYEVHPTSNNKCAKTLLRRYENIRRQQNM